MSHRSSSSVADTLALAMVAASSAPLLLLDGELKILAASASFCHAFRLDPAKVVDAPVTDLGSGEWDIPQLRSLLNATLLGQASIKSYEMGITLDGAPHQLVLEARRLEFSGGAGDLLMLTVADVTQTRRTEKLKDDLYREKAVLLKEVQHRVANSLQIIASVLLQNARRVQSEETRAHLKDAHHRVMSVATLQQQLSASGLGDVRVGQYFTQLCETLAASMIHDRTQLSIAVTADDSMVEADVSVSLGLIVTELVINALKHAFPGGRRGTIRVGYRSNGPNWTLSVEDDGVGMPTDHESRKPGLGTSIVEALAKQLNGRVKVADRNPGTSITINHSDLYVV